MARLSVDYDVSSSIKLTGFFQTDINRPHITNSYPNSNTKGGITVHFSF